MIANFWFMHGLFVLGTVGAAVSIVPESRSRRIKLWRLLLPGAFALLATVVLVLYPDVHQLLRIDLWGLFVGAVLVGIVRGHFIEKRTDRIFAMVQVTPAKDGRWAANFLVLVTAIQIAVEIAGPADHTYLPVVEFCTIFPAGFLLGRAGAMWAKARRLQHSDLVA